MKMDRNLNANGKGKYALLNLREDIIEWGFVGGSNEFFVIKLKDKYAQAALEAYANAAECDDLEWANEVRKLAQRSGQNHPLCKRPD